MGGRREGEGGRGSEKGWKEGERNGVEGGRQEGRRNGERKSCKEGISMCLYNYNLIQYMVVCANPDRCFQLSCQGE